MENKKYLPLKIIHAIFIVVGIVLYAITLISFTQGASALDKASTALNIAALLAGSVYLMLGYKKNAQLSYKIAIWLIVIAEIIECACVFGKGVAISPFGAFRKVLALTLIVLLAGAKDYGVVKSNIISLALVALNIYLVISVATKMSGFAAMNLPAEAVLFDAIGRLVLASTVAFMVCGKYLDKAERGTK